MCVLEEFAQLTVLLGRFSCGLGMHMVAKSDLSTGNTTFASFVLQSHDMVGRRHLTSVCLYPSAVTLSVSQNQQLEPEPPLEASAA